jgi:hypothetical protein
MHKQAAFALAHPVFDPGRDMLRGHVWVVSRDHVSAITATLTVNIGEE